MIVTLKELFEKLREELPAEVFKGEQDDNDLEQHVFNIVRMLPLKICNKIVAALSLEVESDIRGDVAIFNALVELRRLTLLVGERARLQDVSEYEAGRRMWSFYVGGVAELVAATAQNHDSGHAARVSWLFLRNVAHTGRSASWTTLDREFSDALEEILTKIAQEKRQGVEQLRALVVKAKKGGE